MLSNIVSLSAQVQKPELPSMIVPDGLGYNIHFTDARAGEMEMLADSGATIVRMDLSWGSTERTKGVYDFSAFERLTNSLEKFKIRPLYILDYSNKFYDNGLSPHSEEGRTAFARWAAAAVSQFKDRGIIWEMYNEPNIGFWKPKPEPEKYILLALEVGRAIRAVAPNELYIGPANSGIGFPFLEQCFKAGLLEYWDAVSVHPYRQTDPESVLTDYAKLRYLIDQYAPKDKTIPILSAEWGYSSVWRNYNDEIQGKMLPRQWLINLAANVPISIWYDWHDDGKDPKEPEHHFGTTNHDYKKDSQPVYEPKPSYIAAKTFNETFRGFKYNKRLWTDNDQVYIFLFSKDNDIKLAAWTTAKEPINVAIPCSSGKFSAVSYLGEKLPDLTATEKSLTINVSDAPIYLTPLETNQALVDVSRWASFPLVMYQDEKQVQRHRLKEENAVYKTIDEKKMYDYTERFQDLNFTQRTINYVANPVFFSLPIPIKDQLVTVIHNPSGQPFSSEQLTIKKTEGMSTTEAVRTLELKQGETEKIITFPLKSMPQEEYHFSFDIAGYTDLFSSRTMKLIDNFSSKNNETLSAAWGIYPDGDSQIGSEQKIEAADGMVKITYKFDEGWKFIRLAPKGKQAKMEGHPLALGFQIRGDGSGNSVNIRYVDKTGQTFQVHGGRLKDAWTYYFEFALDGSNASHWGGANDGKITYPIRLDSIIIDGTRKACGPYSVMISSPVLIYHKY
ncbi:MAG: hypothetical protein LBI18_04000 [Planctomycetaceae bacterium]|nr:hypothetical protein [Planctomycetaceae bacterium]